MGAYRFLLCGRLPFLAARRVGAYRFLLCGRLPFLAAAQLLVVLSSFAQFVVDLGKLVVSVLPCCATPQHELNVTTAVRLHERQVKLHEKNSR